MVLRYISFKISSFTFSLYKKSYFKKVPTLKIKSMSHMRYYYTLYIKDKD